MSKGMVTRKATTRVIKNKSGVRVKTVNVKQSSVKASFTWKKKK